MLLTYSFYSHCGNSVYTRLEAPGIYSALSIPIAGIRSPLSYATSASTVCSLSIPIAGILEPCLGGLLLAVSHRFLFPLREFSASGVRQRSMWLHRRTFYSHCGNSRDIFPRRDNNVYGCIFLFPLREFQHTAGTSSVISNTFYSHCGNS